MRLDLQPVRLMAAMIVMIIAYVAPSAVEAHEGHANHGRHHGTVVRVPAATPATRVVSEPLAVANVAVALKPVASSKALVVSGVASLRSDDADRGCCPGPCKGSCCGTMSCCVPGILGGSVFFPTLAFGHVVLASHDVDGRSGVGPEALPRPPRTLA